MTSPGANQPPLVDWIYSLQRMPLGSSKILVQNTRAVLPPRFQLIRNVGHLEMPIVFALELRLVLVETGEVLFFPTVPWKVEFGTQDGGIAANLITGRHTVFGDTLVVNSPAHGELPGPIGAVRAIAAACPNPGAPVNWTEI